MRRGKTCEIDLLLVTDSVGTLHWYRIPENLVSDQVLPITIVGYKSVEISFLGRDSSMKFNGL